MCQFQQLYNDETGYVVRCNRCNYYQILFSGTMLSISSDEFERFLIQISYQKQENDTDGAFKKTLILATPRQGVHMFLSMHEFEKLCTMMELAEAEVKALAMIELFHSESSST